ncbi:MAG: bacillithiol biosynthesis deacetylase BshB1 [Longimicrobiales bacterium]|nr:bacillithiol biosynthesis deacetylase BshB1 [Longimicrobiales bacterium]
MSEPLDVLAIMAHPDDAELLCGGALRKSSRTGERAGIVDLTRGEMGTRGSPEVRAREAARAAEILGLAERRNAGLPDGHLENSLDARRVVAGLIRELRPRIVVTHWAEGRHPDHRVAAALVRDAAFLAGLRNFSASGAPHRPLKVVHATAFREDAEPPTFVVDITEDMEDKLAAIAAYESQFVGLTQAGEVYPGGARALPDQIRAACARYGSLIRQAYGEPFRAREVMAWGTLGTLEVATF